MPTEADLKTALDAIQNGLPAVADRITNLVNSVGQVITQADLDEANAIAATVTALGTAGPTGRKK